MTLTCKCELQNCYGINSLNHEFQFINENRIIVIYASNGSMKTSFAKVFLDLQNQEESKDNVYKDQKVKREIKWNGEVLDHSKVFVIQSYVDKYEYPEEVAKLLANDDLKKQYDEINNTIKDLKNNLLNKLVECSGLNNKNECIEQILKDIQLTPSNKSFFKSLVELENEVKPQEDKDNNLSSFKYITIFNDKTAKMIETKDFQTRLAEYLDQYNKIIESSKFFKSRIFDHNHMENVIKNLEKNNFLHKELSNKILLNGNDKPIENIEELKELIKKEKERILSNEDIKKSFDELNKTLRQNQQTKDFDLYLKEHHIILQELAYPLKFKKKLWISYLSKYYDQYIKLVEIYKTNENKLKEIREKIKNDKSKWDEVIKIFNKRFTVPFTIKISNKEDVLLTNEMPFLEFSFDKEIITKERLVKDILSQGEKRALYLLEVIYKIEVRKENKTKTLVIIDDIADSFDYQNKYSIVEYLHDMSKDFYQIILTHNYDFYRTIRSRLIHNNKNAYSYHAVKTDKEIELHKDEYNNNPFNSWKHKLKEVSEENYKYLIAYIPFARNIIEYSYGQQHQGYMTLTSLLHQKKGTADITIKNVIESIPWLKKDNGTVRWSPLSRQKFR